MAIKMKGCGVGGVGGLVVLVVLCVWLGVGECSKERVYVKTDYTWANLAWGFNNGGKDTTDGMKVVEVDIDDGDSMVAPLGKDGHIVICYFSAGTLEPWRPDCQANKTAWQSAAVGNMTGWDEEWLDIRKLSDLQNLMAPRFQRAAAMGCHAVEPDNIDCYQNKDCWGQMTNPKVSHGSDVKDQQITYNKWLASYGQQYGLAVAMKNAVGLVKEMAKDFDFAINEQCQTYSECDDYKYFTNDDKAVFQVEYTSKSSYCNGASKYKMMTKYCKGSNSNGLCDKSSTWTDCFKPTNPLPPTEYHS